MFHKFRAFPQVMKMKGHTEELNGFLQQEKTNNETTYLGLTITQMCRVAVKRCKNSKVKIVCTEVQTAIFTVPRYRQQFSSVSTTDDLMVCFLTQSLIRNSRWNAKTK